MLLMNRNDFIYFPHLPDFSVLPVDIGGPYSSLIHGLGYAFIGMGSSLNPVVMGSLITDHVGIYMPSG